MGVDGADARLARIQMVSVSVVMMGTLRTVSEPCTHAPVSLVSSNAVVPSPATVALTRWVSVVSVVTVGAVMRPEALTDPPPLTISYS